MSQAVKSQVQDGRALAQARRKAMSGAGLAAIKSQSESSAAMSSTRSPVAMVAKLGATVNTSSTPSAGQGRAASLQRRRALSAKGKTAAPGSDRTRVADPSRKGKATKQATPSDPNGERTEEKSCRCGCDDNKALAANKNQPQTAVVVRKPVQARIKRKANLSTNSNSCRAASLARRKAHSARGKAGISKSGMSSAQTARASNPELTGRDLARVLREQKSRKGNAGQKKSLPSGRQRPQRPGKNGPAEDAPWKVGASSTTHGQTVTGSMVGRSVSMTGDEASTCRDITGTEYMGADIFKEFCQVEPVKTARRGGLGVTAVGNAVTGSRIGRSEKVTGDEPGTCKSITGSEYVDSSDAASYCGTSSAINARASNEVRTSQDRKVTGDNVGRSDKVTGNESGSGRELTGAQYTAAEPANAPAKVGESTTLSGGQVTGSVVGRNGQVTGDEPGSCRNVTGDDYVGREQYQQFCETVPERAEKKVGRSKTLGGEAITGSMTGRSHHVTGDEPGTCKAVTGTPYAGSEQVQSFCSDEPVKQGASHRQPIAKQVTTEMTGLQPAVGGKMTGDATGACQAVSGTPYIGQNHQADVCPGQPAEPGSADFPQPLDGNSILSPGLTDQTVGRGIQEVQQSRSSQDAVTGSFGKAAGKVTGTEEARFDREPHPSTTKKENHKMVDGRPVSRVTGEGMDVGSRITGDDWARGDRVTGTEGASSTRRNLTLRGTPPVESNLQAEPQQDAPVPVSKVTGGSGNTDRGALVTYSGGARG